MIPTRPPYFAGKHPIWENAQLQWLMHEDGIALRYAQWDGGTRGTVHIFNGRTEYIEKYADVIARFVSMGFNVTCHDWRGQGLSSRATGVSTRGHIEDFADYQRDADTVINAARDLAGPHYLFCHSMGGAIGTRYLLRGNHRIKRAIYSAPMWKIHLSPPLELLARNVIKFHNNFGGMERVAIGTRDEAYETYEPFKRNLLTSDAETYDKMRKFFTYFSEFTVGGPTYAWLDAARDETEDLANHDLPEVSSLVFVGENEKVVSRQVIVDRTEGNDHYRLVDFPDAKHEVYLEIPKIRDAMWSHIEDFLR